MNGGAAHAYTIFPKLANGEPVFIGGLRGGSGPNEGRFAPSPAPAAPPAAGTAPSISLSVKVFFVRRFAKPPPRPLAAGSAAGKDCARLSFSDSFMRAAADESGP